jgi:hypothetical protein
MPGSRKQHLAAATLLLPLLAVAACSSGGSSAGTSKDSSAGASQGSSAGQAKGVALPKGVTNAAGVPTKVANIAKLRNQVQLTSCHQAPGGWMASGTATNPAGTAADYTIAVFFTTKSATVIGTGSTRVRVPGKAHQQWAVTKRFTAAPSTVCVLRGVG